MFPGAPRRSRPTGLGCRARGRVGRCRRQRAGPHPARTAFLEKTLPVEGMRAEVRPVVEGGGLTRRSCPVDAGALLAAHLHLDRPQVFLQLLHGANPDDGTGDPRLLGAPCQGELARSASPLIGHFHHDVQDIVGPIREQVLVLTLILEARVLRTLPAATVLPGEKSARHGRPGNERRSIGDGPWAPARARCSGPASGRAAARRRSG